MAQAPELTDEERALLVRCGFEPGVAYMPVPRCDGCRWWRLDADNGRHREGECHRELEPGSGFRIDQDYTSGTRIMTAPDFGCVQWEAKG